MLEPEHALAESQTLAAAARDLFRDAEQLHWASYDPFDLLLAPSLNPLRAIAPLAARAAIQIGKLGGIGLRRALGIRPHEEAKTLADYLRAAVLLTRSGERWATAYVDVLCRRLVERAIVVPQGLGWGLEFPYASRFVNAPARAPNNYVTTLAAQALRDAHEVTRAKEALEAARAGARFLAAGLGHFEHEGHRWLRYWQGSNDRIVNIQASSAGILARIGEDEPRLVALADDAAKTVLAAQCDNGSWPYSADGRANFTDGFHTGFTLEGLCGYRQTRGSAAVDGVEDAIRSGFRYFKRHLMTQDQLPRGVADGSVSLDGQNVAQCVQTLVLCAEDHEDVATALHVWAVGNRVEDGRFPALRWTLGPTALATAHLLTALRDRR